MSTCQGHCFFITFTDNATCYTITFLAHKGDALNMYCSFEVWVSIQNLCTAIKVLCSDHGGKYLSIMFDKHLVDVDTMCWLTVHDTPQLNGIAERLNQMLMEKVHVLLHTSGMPQNLWGKALHHLTWLKNCTSMWALGGKTP
jgi:hypothetical protein